MPKSLVRKTWGLTTGGGEGRRSLTTTTSPLWSLVIGHGRVGSWGCSRGLAPSCPRRRGLAKHHTGMVRGDSSDKAPKAARKQDGRVGEIHNSGLCTYTSQILQLEERPWPVSACARVFSLRCRRRREKTDSPTRRTRSRRTRPFGRTPNRPEARCRLNRPRPTSRPPGLP